MDQRTSCVPAISIGFFAAILALHSSPLFAARDCEGLAHPHPEGGHWYYRVERATGRRCWHLDGEPAATAPQVEAAPQPPQSDTVRLLSSFWSSLFSPASTPQPDAVNRDAVAQVEPRRHARAPKRRREAQAKLAPEPKPKPLASPNQSDRDALFRQYLHWQEQQ